MKTHRTAHAGGGGGERSPQVLPELFGMPTGEKTQGRGQGGSAANFFLGPPHGPCRRGGGAGPPSVAGGGGCRVAEKLRVDDREEALPIFYWALNIYSSQFYANLPSLPTPPYPALSAPRPLFGLVPSPASEQHFVRLGCVNITSRQGPS